MRFLKVFEKSGNESKIWGNGPKIWGNRSTKWDFLSLWKSRNRSKIWGNNLKFEETDQQNEIFKKFLKKRGNRSKIWGNWPKISVNQLTNWEF